MLRELSLIGNQLECDGCNEFLRPLVSLIDSHIAATSTPLIQTPDHTITDEAETVQSHPQAPPPLPPLAKLFLQDNCIDVHGECTGMDGVFASVLCMRALKR